MYASGVKVLSAANKNPKTAIWFSKQPLGGNTISSLASNMSKHAKLPSTRLTNHSGRKTAIQTLLHFNVAPTDVIQITGHKNVLLLNAYSHISIDQQHAISSVLSDRIAGQSKSANIIHKPVQLSQTDKISPQEDVNISNTSFNSPNFDEYVQYFVSDEFNTEFEPQQQVDINKHLTNIISTNMKHSQGQHSSQSSQQLLNAAAAHVQPKPSPFSFVNCTFNGAVTINVTRSPAEVPCKKIRMSEHADSSEE